MHDETATGPTPAGGLEADALLSVAAGHMILRPGCITWYLGGTVAEWCQRRGQERPNASGCIWFLIVLYSRSVGWQCQPTNSENKMSSAASLEGCGGLSGNLARTCPSQVAVWVGSI